MNQEVFTQKLKESVFNKLKEHLDSESFNTKVPISDRKSHAYSFCQKAMNSIFTSTVISSWSIIGYKIDDADSFDNLNVQEERQRLLTDVNESTDILNFIIHKFYWK